MTSPRFLIKSRLITVLYGPDLLRNWNAKLLIIYLCYREDLTIEGERPLSALRLEFRGWHGRVSSDARLILDRNLEAAEGRLYRKS